MTANESTEDDGTSPVRTFKTKKNTSSCTEVSTAPFPDVPRLPGRTA
eukprot:CAMPEP_0194717808 /NCGR_PEP_ID=MMETSP0296-20130528/9427_1 /TAXON_ID=39354 /ORGANISM="Heterosigma akashiwo, Strain CCMP2393" /LENGTH=46 /DNA_ID= /DNA_START= /DNA_END= /DNA_ORIENTATION=